MSSNPASQWDQLNGKFYRKQHLYELEWEFRDLTGFLVAAAPLAGTLAVMRDPSKIQSYRGTTTRQEIQIFTSSGALLRRITWDKSRVRGLGWSEEEDLVVVTEDGLVRIYHDLQSDFTQISLGKVAEQVGVENVQFWGQGFVAFLKSREFVAVTSYTEPRPKEMASPAISSEDPIHSWAIIPPVRALARHIEVIVATRKTILAIDFTESQDQLLEQGPITRMAVSPNGASIALHTQEGKVWVISSDFQQNLFECDTEMGNIAPSAFCWCGNNTVLAGLDDDLIVLSSGDGPNLKYFFDSSVHVLPDVDSARLISGNSFELFQQVSDSSEQIFKIGSTSPAAILLDAQVQLEQMFPKADDNLKIIRNQLTEAVDTCVKAAGEEFDTHWQKQLLRAASLGKSVLELYNSDDFVEMCETLRVLNACRSYKVGIPLTHDQFLQLNPDRLLQRLINRKEYLLAIRISEFLNLSTDKIYVHWACAVVRNSIEDEGLICRNIVDRLSSKKNISFEAIARVAYDEGRSHLAIELLNHESRIGLQVPLLLNMEEEEIALVKAIESRDSDLVFFVLWHLKQKLPLAQFFRLMNDKPVAAGLLEAYAREQDLDLLKDFYYQDDRRADGAHVIFEEALRKSSHLERIDDIKKAQKLLQESKEYVFEVKMLDDYVSLLKMQAAFEKDLHQEFNGLSLMQTLSKLIKLGQHSRASKIKSDFKINDRRFWWLKLLAIVEKRDWEELDRFGKSAKSPIGYEPFYNACLEAGNLRQAAQYIPRCNSLTAIQRIEMWIRVGDIKSAGEEAFRAKDVLALQQIRTRVQSGPQASELDKMLQQLRAK